MNINELYQIETKELYNDNIAEQHALDLKERISKLTSRVSTDEQAIFVSGFISAAYDYYYNNEHANADYSDTYDSAIYDKAICDAVDCVDEICIFLTNNAKQLLSTRVSMWRHGKALYRKVYEDE